MIPVNPLDKKPLVKWVDYQKRKATVQEIESWWSKWPNAMIGGITGNISNDFVIDIDNEQGEEALTQYVPDSILTPTAKTPRGGKHLHFLNPEEDISIRAGILPHVDYRGQGGFIVLPPSCNADGKKYFWLDGLSLEEQPKAAIPQDLLLYIKVFINNIISSSSEKQLAEVTQSHKMYQLGTRDQDLFHIANQLVKSNTQKDVILQTLEIIALNCNPPFPKNEIRVKIESAFQRAKRKEINISEDLRLWVESQEGHFKVTEYHAESQVVTKEQKHAVIQALKRLQDEGIVEKYGNQRGVYRRIEGKADKIDFMGVEDNIINISWPLEVEKWVNILPKNIIVIAGESNAGKTAFLLNFCLNNMGKFKINYFSSVWRKSIRVRY